MNEGIRGEMMQLDSVVVQKPREEIRLRKTQSPFKIRCKSNNSAHIFIQTIMTQGRTLLNHRSRMQKTLANKGLQVGSSTLTWKAPLFACGLGLHILSLGWLLGRHAECHWTLLAHAVATLTGDQGRQMRKNGLKSRSTEKARIDLILRGGGEWRPAW